MNVTALIFSEVSIGPMFFGVSLLFLEQPLRIGLAVVSSSLLVALEENRDIFLICMWL